MAILIIHITDIHIRGASDEIVSRADLLIRAALAGSTNVEACFVVASGDIANTGSPEEYEAALIFFGNLRSALTVAGIAQVELVAVPGNHDLCLADEVDTRSYVLESVEKFVSNPIDLTGLTYDAVISVHGKFFGFEATARKALPVADSSRLYYRRTFVTGTRTVSFHCFNTAWLSRRHELQAKLYLPSQIFVNDADVSDLSVGVFHHPYNWLNANNAHDFRKYIESNVDIALTGHEHNPGGARQLNLAGESVDYFQGPALRDPTSGESGFQVLRVDFESSVQTLTRYSWRVTLFHEESWSTWSLSRNTRRPSPRFVNNLAFLKDLRSMDAGFHHPRCQPPHCELKLRDLYVYPSLRHHNPDYKVTKEGTPSKQIRGEQLVDFFKAHEKVIVFGSDEAGKTALAKILYEDLASQDLTPIALNGELLRSRSRPGQIDNAIREAIKDQYSSDQIEAIQQLPHNQRLLIIDDFDKAHFVRANQELALRHIGESFGSVIVFASDLMQLQELAKNSDSSPLRGYEFCNIREFGKFHRHKLIHRWLHLGREDEEEYESLDKEVREKDKTISTLLGKNVLPHYPFTILTLLQLLESRETPNTANGAYGYLYEVLI